MTRRFLSCFSVPAILLVAVAGIIKFLPSGASADHTVIQVPAPEYWPTAGWRESTPERQGIDSAALLKMFDYVREHHTRVHNVLIIRNGYVVLDASFFPYDGGTPHDLASVTKSFTSTLIGAAIQDGKISGANARVLSFFPQEDTHNGDPRKARMTLGDLLAMRSGLACETKQSEQILRDMRRARDEASFVLNLPMKYEPGKRFEYCSGNFHVLSAVISRATHMSEAEYAREALFRPLGIHDVIWPADPQGVTHGWGDLHLSPRDAAKVGLLWLQGGVWESKRVLAEEWWREATTALTKTMSPDAGYGYGFWVFVGRRAGEYEALGRGGQRITVVPKLNAIVVLTGGGFEPEEIGSILSAAVKSDHALPENPGAIEELHKAMATALAAPLPGENSALSPTANQISGKTFALEANPLDLRDLILQFPAPEAATLEMTVGSRRLETHPVSLNQKPALSPGQFGLPVALRGKWEKDTFALDYDEIANNHAYRLLMRFQGNNVEIQVYDYDSRKTIIIRGHAK